MLTDPNTVLRDANVGKTIIKTISFTVSTCSATPEQGGGTTNIAFLRGAPNRPRGLVGGLLGGVAGALVGGPIHPIAEAVQMYAIFWIETVQHSIVVPPFKPGQVS
jgi:hypothetical protein